MNDYDVQFLSSLSPKIDRKKKTKCKGPTLLSLRKHFRKSLLLDQSQRIATNNSISVIEISSGDSGCSNDVKEFKSCSKIIIEESNSEGGNTQETNVSHISNINSDNEEIIPPSPNRKKITYECVSTSKIKKLSKLHCGDLPKTKLFEIMKWKKDVEEFNKEVLDKEKIQPYDSIERSVVSYDEFENKRKLEENQLLNSTMLPIPMKNNDCGDYKYIDKFYDDTRHKKSLQELDNKFVSSSDEDGNLNKSCEDLLDELYGSSWRLKRDEVLSKSEKKLRKKNVLERENLPKSERKSKQSDYDSKKLNQNNLLKLVQRRGIKKVIDFPIMEDCCDEKQYNDNESLKTLARDIMNCDLSQKVSAIHPNKVLEKEIESFEFRDSKKYDDENKIDFSDKENVYSLKIISLDNKELECSGSGEKLKETHKLKKKKVQVKGDKNNLQTRDNNQKEPMFSTITEKAADKLPDTKDIVCHIKNEEKNCLNDKVRKTKTKESTEIDSDIENFTLKSVEEIEIINRSEKTRYSFLESLSKHIPDSQCNIKAKIFRNNYKQYKEHLAKKLFDLYNKEIFNNALPNTTVLEWNIRMSSTAGFCHSKKITHRSGDVERISKIVLSAKVLDSADRLRDTLIHEMCHAATWVVDQISNGHGECWMAWTNKARQVFPELPPIKRCHNYQINTKYTYRCTGCGYSIGRHRKSLDIERKRCGYCLGKFEVLINKVNKKGQQKTVPSTPKREPTGFALFVKENYSHFKAPGVNHGSVMKLLSEKFNEMKV
ncbi:hypothetical protein WA026_017055 [Henosepilachna vigintioctopunctata]|uniref:SprT-like domain-containing protein n=1 Tax=Henosepilachna vigintioctopunctata TaxID=420089 RepID=A0AAW1TNC0_9CUCU